MSDHVLWETIKEQNEKIAELEEENRLLGERCYQLLKDKGNLTDKIADIKANCDLAIEGRDIKIKELEQQLDFIRDERNKFQEKCEDIELNYYCDRKGGCKVQELEEENNKLLDVINNQDVKIADLEKQIEKMKCCEMYKHKNLDWVFNPICEARDKIKIENPLTCKCDKWEIKENG